MIKMCYSLLRLRLHKDLKYIFIKRYLSWRGYHDEKGLLQ